MLHRICTALLCFFVVGCTLVFGTPVRGELAVSIEGGQLSFRGDGVQVEDAQPQVDLLVGKDAERLQWSPQEEPRVEEKNVVTPLGPGVETISTWDHPAGFQLAWMITELEETAGFSIQLRVTNTGDHDLVVKKLSVLNASQGSVAIAGDESNWMTSSRYLKYARYYDRLDRLRERGQLKSDNGKSTQITRQIPYEEDFCLYTEAGKRGLSISAVTDQAYNWITLGVPADSNELSLEVWSEMTGVLVEPGESRLSEKVLVQLEPWREAGERAVAWMRSVLKPRDTPAIYGWCSWYCAGMAVTQEHCFQTADFVRKHRDRYPFQTMQVDEGWHIGRHNWYPNEKFQAGTRALVQKFESAGETAGVWMTPISPNSQRVVDGKVFHTGGKGGSGVRSFDPSWYVGYRRGKPSTGSLDPSSPGAAEYIEGELRRLRDLGYRYFKTDFSKVAAMEAGYHNPKLTSFQAQRLLYGLMRKAIGKESYLLACNGGPARVVAGLADATRIGTDSGTKWGFCNRANDFGKPGNVHGAWFPILQVGCASAYTGLIACDPDVTRLDNVGYANYDPRFNGRDPRNPDKPMPVKLSLDSVQTFHGLLTLYGGTMMVSDLMYEAGYQELNRLRMAEIMHPVLNERGYNFAGGSDVLCHQFGFEAERPWGRWVSMVTWNPDHTGQKNVAINHAPTVGLGDAFHVWSFWDEKYLGVQDADYQFDGIRHYHSKLVRLTPVSRDGSPTLIGSNLHMGMGAAEISDVRTSKEGISVDLNAGAGAIEGQLVFHSSTPLKIEIVAGCKAFVMQCDQHIYSVVLTERDRAQPQQLVLRRTDTKPPTLEEVQKDQRLERLWRSATQTLMQ